MSRIAKAIAAGATTLGGTFATAMNDGVLTVTEAVTIACAVIVSIAAVYRVPND